MKRAVAPWTVPQLLEITDYQQHSETSSYICLNDGTVYAVRIEGLYCRQCGRTQEAVHGAIANGRWRCSVGSRVEQLRWLIEDWRANGGRGMHLHEWLGMTPTEYDTYAASAVLPVEWVPPKRWNEYDQ